MFDWACKEGEIDSCYFAAGHHIAHHNAERNPKLAIDYFERSCKSNHAPSCYNLAVLYRNGDIGVDKDTEKFEHYKDITNKLVKQVGGLGGKKTN